MSRTIDYTARATGSTYRFTFRPGRWADNGGALREWTGSSWVVHYVAPDGTEHEAGVADNLTYDAPRVAERFAREVEAAAGRTVEEVTYDDLRVGDKIVYPVQMNGTVVEQVLTVTGFDESFPVNRGLYFGPRAGALADRRATARRVVSAP